MLEKKYCLHCRTIQDEAKICKICGRDQFQSIIIHVQYHSQTDK
ncbi:hypothetical protein [Peribacillus cavernae]|nr:hypothetical protein [Peribacillus cavernae]MDQ0218932.1 RNA polymerase subunit RPABC4/transcription elongation factor Spt4 [Peribacillus cavernae]